MESQEDTFRFADVELDVRRRLLSRAGTPLVIQRKPLDLLIYLVRHRAKAVSKDEIFRDLWPNEFVEESSLSVSILKIRKALGDSGETPTLIRTVYGFGYQFVGQIEARIAEVRPPAAATEPVNNPAAAERASGLVGREAEIGMLRRAWAEVLSGQTRVAFVVGPAGIGKSTLLESFLADAACDHSTAWVFKTNCLEHLAQSEPFTPWTDGLVHLCRSEAREQILSTFRDVAPAWLLQIPGALDATARRAVVDECGRMPLGRSGPLLAESLRRLARTRPMILLVEDMHWCDSASMDVFSRLAHDSQDGRLLLIGTYRHDDALRQQPAVVRLRDELAVRRRCLEMELGPLSVEDLPAFLAKHHSDLEPTATLCEQLFERSHGHPLFLRALLDHLHAGYSLDRVPGDLRRMIEHKVGALDDEEQTVLRAASLVGVEFTGRAIAAALQRSEEEIEEILEDLTRRRSMVERGQATEPLPVASTYRFLHPLYATVLDESLTKARRRVFHLRLAQHYAEREGVREATASTVARHFEQAGEFASAFEAHARAVEEAAKCFAFANVMAAARAGIALAAGLPASESHRSRELMLRLALARALVAIETYPTPEFIDNVTRALDLARRLDLLEPQVQTMLVLSIALQVRGDAREALRLTSEMVDLAERQGPSRWPVTTRKGHLCALVGDLRQACALLEPSPLKDENLLSPQGSLVWGGFLDHEAIRLANWGFALGCMGRFEQGYARMREALVRARDVGHRYSQAISELWMTHFQLLRGDLAAARAAAENAAKTSVEGDYLASAQHMKILVDLVDVLRLPSEETTARLSESIRELEERGVLWTMPLMRAALAEGLGRISDIASGFTTLDQAFRIVLAGGEHLGEPEMHRVQGELSWAHARLLVNPATSAWEVPEARPAELLEAAEAAFRKAIDVARKQENLCFELRAALSLHRLRTTLGDAAESRSELVRLLASFQEGLEAPILRETAQVLELAPRSKLRSIKREHPPSQLHRGKRTG